jgi:hypothetical protein
VIPVSHHRDESGDGSSLCFSSRSRALLDGHGLQLLISEAGNHIRQEIGRTPKNRAKKMRKIGVEQENDVRPDYEA